jgi:hypothetical protein
MAMYSSWPPPIVPWIAAGDTSMKAPVSRGVEPFVPATSTRASGPALARKSFRSCTVAVIICIPTGEI